MTPRSPNFLSSLCLLYSFSPFHDNFKSPAVQGFQPLKLSFQKQFAFFNNTSNFNFVYT